MTTEKDKAYKAWWEKWWADPEASNGARPLFDAGWDAAFNSCPKTADEIIHTARQNERDEIERKLLAMAGAAFIANKDDHAHWFRSLVNVLFKKLGDTSA